MKLYYHPLSTYCQKVLVALYEADISFELNLINLFDEEQRKKYREIYPIGKIPLLILDDGHPIPESSIIIEYIDSISDKIDLIPSDATEARKTRFLDRMYDLYLNNSVGTLFFELRKSEEERSQKLIADCREKISTMYDYMENNLSDKTWNRGDNFTLADCAAGPALFYAQEIAPFQDRPNILGFWQRFSDRSSYQKILNEAKPLLEAM